MKKIDVIFILSIITGGNAQGFGTGVVPFNCPMPTALMNKLPFKTQVLPCDQDCVHNHKAKNGACDSVGNCICDYRSTTPQLNATIPVAYSEQYCTGTACQCSNTGISEVNINVCIGDCTCNHGATGGTCDFENKQCHCDYDFNSTFPKWTQDMCIIEKLIQNPNGISQGQAMMVQLLTIQSSIKAASITIQQLDDTNRKVCPGLPALLGLPASTPLLG